MKHRYRLFRRGWGTYYCEDRQTGKQETLRTRDKAEAYRLVAARNETEQQPAFSLHLPRVYWKAGNPAAASRTWQHVIDELLKLKSGNTLIRWRTASQDKALDPLRPLVLLETHSHHLLRVLEKGSVSTNLYLRRLHNFALDMSWLPWPVLPRKNWPIIRFKEKRAITRQEHEAIVAREPNPEWRAFYELLWATGGSQSDVASLTAEHVDRDNRILSYPRAKTASVSCLRYGPEVEGILAPCPGRGGSSPGWPCSTRSTGPSSSGAGAWACASTASRFIPTVTRGPSGRGGPDTPSGSPRKPWATTARRCIGPMPARPRCCCPPWSRSRRPRPGTSCLSRRSPKTAPAGPPPKRRDSSSHPSTVSWPGLPATTCASRGGPLPQASRPQATRSASCRWRI